jgi:hypothetical protein
MLLFSVISAKLGHFFVFNEMGGQVATCPYTIPIIIPIIIKKIILIIMMMKNNPDNNPHNNDDEI